MIQEEISLKMFLILAIAAKSSSNIETSFEQIHELLVLISFVRSEGSDKHFPHTRSGFPLFLPKTNSRTTAALRSVTSM